MTRFAVLHKKIRKEKKKAQRSTPDSKHRRKAVTAIAEARREIKHLNLKKRSAV